MDKKFSSPTLVVKITEEDREKAIRSNSGGCLIADGIKRQYPHLTGITVDMATVRASDRKLGVRYTYLQTAPGQHCLLSFDQGWPSPIDQVVYKKAVQIQPIRDPGGAKKGLKGEARKERIAELEAKLADGSITPHEKGALTLLKQTGSKHARAEVHIRANDKGAVVYGGRSIVGPDHPNLLRGRDRHFGARIADPGIAFNEAVEKAVEERLKAQQ